MFFRNKLNFLFFPSFLTSLIVIVLLNSCSVFAQGNLLIMPRRVVFEGNKQFQELNLANSGQDSAQYMVSLINYRMKESGEFELITTPDEGQHFADKNVRVFPRMVMLGPNEAQTVKVQLYKANQLAPGEYRSHLYFRAVPRPVPLGGQSVKKDTVSSGVSVRLIPVFGLSIPIIIRTGESTAKVTLSNCSLDNNGQLKINFNRTGNMSVYGDLVVNHISPTGKKTRVGLAKGLSVYTPNSVRQFQLNLDQSQHVDYHSGELLITYNSQQELKPEKLAETELLLH